VTGMAARTQPSIAARRPSREGTGVDMAGRAAAIAGPAVPRNATEAPGGGAAGHRTPATDR
jgi:hypothetical protein